MSTVVLGIDPGTTIIGFGVVRASGNALEPLEHGIISNPGKDKALDLENTARLLSAIIEKHRPTAASVERLFFFNNKKTAMAVSEMRGVILLTLARHRIPVQEFTPLQVKQQICNYGKAEKKQVQKMVQMLLGLKEVVRPDDAADALALAICGTLTSSTAQD